MHFGGLNIDYTKNLGARRPPRTHRAPGPGALAQRAHGGVLKFLGLGFQVSRLKSCCPGGHHARIGRLGLAPSRSALTAALLLAAGLAAISLAARARAAAAAARARSAQRALTPELLAAWRATLVEARAEPDQARLRACTLSGRGLEYEAAWRALISGYKRTSTPRSSAIGWCLWRFCASHKECIIASARHYIDMRMRIK